MWSFPNIKSERCEKDESPFPKIEIQIPEGKFAKIKIDGNEIKGVEGYELIHGTEDIPILRIDIIAFDTTIEADTVPILPEFTYGACIPFDKLIKSGIATYEQLIELNEIPKEEHR